MLLLIKRFVLFILLKSAIESLFLNKFNKSLSLKKSFMLSLVSGIASIGLTLLTLYTIKKAALFLDFNHLASNKTSHFLINTVAPLIFILMNNIIFCRLAIKKLTTTTNIKSVPFAILIGLLSGTLLFGALYHAGSPLLCFLHL